MTISLIARSVNKVTNLPQFPHLAKCVLPESFKPPPRPMPHHAPRVLPGSSLRTTVTTGLTTIPLKIASSAHRANTVHWVPLFAIGALQVIEHLKIKRPTKPVVCCARVGVTKHKRVETSAKTAAAENTNPKTAPLFVCPATLGCINRKRGNRTAQNARKTITPTNPNKPHAKLVCARKKRRIQVLPSVSNVMRDNSCPSIKLAHGAN